MSTILTALNKVHRETPLEVVFQARAHALDLNHSINAAIFKNMRRRRLVAIAMALTAVLGAGLAVFFGRDMLWPPAPKPLPQKYALQKIVPSPTAEKSPQKNSTTNIVADPPSRGPQAALSAQNTFVPSKPTIVTVAPTTAAAPSPVAAAPPAPPAPPIPAAMDAGRSESAPLQQPGRAVAKPAAADMASPNTSLKLQAIAWNENAAQRIAVIGNRIFHEGEMLDGWRIERIAAHEVTLYNGERRWALSFTPKP